MSVSVDGEPGGGDTPLRLATDLRLLRGALSYRDLAARIERRLPPELHRTRSTLADAEQSTDRAGRDRVPPESTIFAFVRGCGLDDAAAREWVRRCALLRTRQARNRLAAPATVNAVAGNPAAGNAASGNAASGNAAAGDALCTDPPVQPDTPALPADLPTRTGLMSRRHVIRGRTAVLSATVVAVLAIGAVVWFAGSRPDSSVGSRVQLANASAQQPESSPGVGSPPPSGGSTVSPATTINLRSLPPRAGDDCPGSSVAKEPVNQHGQTVAVAELFFAASTGQACAILHKKAYLGEPSYLALTLCNGRGECDRDWSAYPHAAGPVRVDGASGCLSLTVAALTPDRTEWLIPEKTLPDIYCA